MSIKNDGHYFCGAGGNRPDGSDEALTNARLSEWQKGCRLIWHEWLILFLVICILVTAGGLDE
ncbi:hypothetical protein GQZ87_005127 [Salmonella enterica]|nr:hypothetical protein [Salmonella enterica]EBE5320307.1 hypothetical protein [Salmonella enterica]EBQ8621154.1 hypothetical protein [Salmonella enterica]EDS9490319.1 hypothetical protein [Salmonella enterica]